MDAFTDHAGSKLWRAAVSRRGNTHAFFAPVSTYPTSDGYVYLAVGNERQWEALSRLPEFEALARQEYASNSSRIANVERLNREMAAVTRRLPTSTLIETLNEIGIPVSVVNQVSDVCQDPLIAGRWVRAVDSHSGLEICIPPPPILSDYLQQRGRRLAFPPRLGEHNQAVFGDLGCNVADLSRGGVL